MKGFWFVEVADAPTIDLGEHERAWTFSVKWGDILTSHTVYAAVPKGDLFYGRLQVLNGRLLYLLRFSLRSAERRRQREQLLAKARW